jgi:hypothetical protein
VAPASRASSIPRPGAVRRKGSCAAQSTFDRERRLDLARPRTAPRFGEDRADGFLVVLLLSAAACGEESSEQRRGEADEQQAPTRAEDKPALDRPSSSANDNHACADLA